MSRAATRSRSVVKALLAVEDTAPASAVSDDLRAADLAASRSDDAAVLEVVREVFSGTSLVDDSEKVLRILRVRSEVRKEWSDARDAFLAVGRALVSLEAHLTRAEHNRLRKGTERLFPFSDATATQLRQIARAVDNGRIPLNACPGSYGTAYQITLLGDAALGAARERGLLRQDVTRREIMELRREFARAAQHGPAARVDRAVLREERRRLDARRARIAAALQVIEVRLEQIDDLLSDEPRALERERANEASGARR